MPSSPPPPSSPSRTATVRRRAPVALVVLAVGAATLAGLLLQGWVSVVLLGLVVLALAAFTLGTWHRLTVPGRALRVLVIGFLAATVAARLPS